MKIELSKLVVSILTISFLALFTGIAFGQTQSGANGPAGVNETVTPYGNYATTISGNVAQTITISTPITEKEKTTVSNIAINFTINLGIINPTVVDVRRDEDDAKNLRVKLKDKDSGENIIIIITPSGEPKENVQNKQRFTETENNFNGNHVSFQFTNDTILNYTIDGKLIFQSINLGFTSTKTTKIGSEFRISDNNNMIILHDDENGIITESSSENIIALYTPATDIKAKITGKRVDFSDNVKASILSSDPDSNEVVPSITGDVINVAINRGRSTFIFKSVKGGDFDDRVVEGIAEKKVGNIINIDADDSHDITTFDVDSTINNVVQNTININVNSDITTGRVIALRVNKDILKDLNLRVLVDGNEIPRAKDFDDLFKTERLANLIVIGQDIEVLISIPKFSEHNIVVTSAPIGNVVGTTVPTITTVNTPTVMTTSTYSPTPSNPTPRTPGFTAAGLVLAIITILVLLKRWK